MVFLRLATLVFASANIFSASEIALSQSFADLDRCDKDFSCAFLDTCDTLLPMPNDSYQDALRTATDELSELMEQREELQSRLYQIQHRINVLRDGIFGLCTMVGEDPYTTRPELFGNDEAAPEVGFTDAVRAVLRNSGKFLTPVDVRDELRRTGFDVDKYRNPLASIHQILRRLVKSDEVETNEDEEKKVYRWKARPVTVWIRTPAGGKPPILKDVPVPAKDAVEKKVGLADLRDPNRKDEK
ncbi:MAG TPA: hypothetical protein VGV59_05370 [Pyrinomonadaceae bacterium]|nr:hypothetical protein [Pyrinomonadaceae bacterium]